jgi:replicative DNA helicase
MALEIRSTDSLPLEQHLNTAAAAIQRLYSAKCSPLSIPKAQSTGFYQLDLFTQGLIPGQITVIASRHSEGKSTLAMNIAEHIAVDQKIPVGIFSLGCCATQLAQRLLLSRAQVSPDRIRNGFMDKGDIARLDAANNDLKVSKIFIEDPAELGLQELRDCVTRLIQEHCVALIVIDYLDLMGATWKTGENREREIYEISSGIKSVAEEFKIPILVLADQQLNVSGLELSAPIARFADVVCFLELKDPHVTSPTEEVEVSTQGSPREVVKRFPASVIIAKNRNGLLGEAPFVFLSEIARFESC